MSITHKLIVACVEAAGYKTWDSRVFALARAIESEVLRLNGITGDERGEAKPCGWMRLVKGHTAWVVAETEWGADRPEKPGTWMPLYATPPQQEQAAPDDRGIDSQILKERVPLTDEKKRELLEACGFTTGENMADGTYGRRWRSKGTASNVWERDLFDLIDMAVKGIAAPSAPKKG